MSQVSVFPPSAQVGCCALEVTKVSSFIVLPLGRGRMLRPRRYLSIAIYHVSPCAQVGWCALEVTKASPFIVFPPLSKQAVAPSKLPHTELPKCRLYSVPPICPGRLLRPRRYQSVAIRVPPSAQVGCCARIPLLRNIIFG